MLFSKIIAAERVKNYYSYSTVYFYSIFFIETHSEKNAMELAIPQNILIYFRPFCSFFHSSAFSKKGSNEKFGMGV